MVAQDEDESLNCLGLSGHGRLALNVVGLCELADSKVSMELFEEDASLSRGTQVERNYDD